ncbi:hypothetical protein ACX12E_00965 [Paenibacillus vandeheii]
MIHEQDWKQHSLTYPAITSQDLMTEVNRQNLHEVKVWHHFQHPALRALNNDDTYVTTIQSCCSQVSWGKVGLPCTIATVLWAKP